MRRAKEQAVQRELHAARPRCEQVRVVWPPHCDYVRCTGPGTPDAYGFIERAGRWWQPGWWAKSEVGEQTKRPRTVADAEHAARSWPQPFAAGMHLTRVDIACDVVLPRMGTAQMAFTMEHRLLFTGRGRRKTEEKKHDLATLYLGGRESPVMLRIYDKTESKNVCERDRSMWRAHGWNGVDKVWRIEYEFHTKGLPSDLELPRDVAKLWADGLARIRMCETIPRIYAEQCRAPTHPWWCALGRAEKLTRRACGLTPLTPPDRLANIMRSLERLAVSAGPDALAAMMVRLTRYQLGSGGQHHGKGSRKAPQALPQHPRDA